MSITGLTFVVVWVVSRLMTPVLTRVAVPAPEVLPVNRTYSPSTYACVNDRLDIVKLYVVAELVRVCVALQRLLCPWHPGRPLLMVPVSDSVLCARYLTSSAGKRCEVIRRIHELELDSRIDWVVCGLGEVGVVRRIHIFVDPRRTLRRPHSVAQSSAIVRPQPALFLSLLGKRVGRLRYCSSDQGK